jgi:hypothetical protein
VCQGPASCVQRLIAVAIQKIAPCAAGQS